MGREEGRGADDVVHPADPGDGHQEAASEQHVGVLVRLLQVQVSRRRRLGKVDEQGDGLLGVQGSDRVRLVPWCSCL